MNARRVAVWAALSGIVAALVVLAVAELVALFISPASSPLFGVGSLVIDLVPGWFKNVVIALFGTNDKLALFVALGLLVAVLAVIVGLLERRRPPWGSVLLGVVAAVAVGAVVTRADASPLWAAPTLVGAACGILVLRSLARRLAAYATGSRAGTRVTRRAFLAMLAATAGGSLVVGITARTVNAANAAVNTLREALKLPAPAVPAPPIPTGADLRIDGMSDLITANADFYRIDTALQVPVIDAAAWTLKVTGMVQREVTMTFAELLALPLTESVMTLTCVSNDVGGNLIGNATWLGYPIRELLKRAGPLAGADMVLSKSVDGYTASTPLEALLDEERFGVLAVGMNGEPLPLEHGFPVRMVVAGLYGYVSATKWLVELEVTRFADKSAYWTDRGWAEQGPVKVASRIDVPAYLALVPEGIVAIAGVAWAQHDGIAGVEVRIDRTGWVPARLASPISIDTWCQWVYEWTAVKGAHLIEVRATNRSGVTQVNDRLSPFPNGAEGWHQITVEVV
ncbi:MAG: oxidoreductase [Rhodoglobus sp.]|nr:oxidoreductase [Rhodoglobus sp.]